MLVTNDTTIYAGSNEVIKAYQGMNVIYEKQVTPPYTEVNYIQASGTQYIDTLINGGTNAEYEIKFNPLTRRIRYEQYFSGDQVTIDKVGKLYNDSQNVYYQNSYGTASSIVGSLGDIIYDFKVLRSSGVTVNGTTLIQTYEGFPWGTLSFWIFGSHSETNLKSSMRLYSLKMYTDGVKVRDFIPVLDENNVACLYDKVSKTYFYNSGTGNFTYG